MNNSSGSCDEGLIYKGLRAEGIHQGMVKPPRVRCSGKLAPPLSMHDEITETHGDL